METETDKKAVVLIVDDEPINVMIAERILQKNGYETISANHGNNALEILQTKQVDLILLDLMMPEINGFEVCEKLMHNEKTKDIPVIFLTAVTDKESIIKGFEVGGKDYLTKPFNTTELVARVKTHVDLKLARDSQEKLIKELKSALDEIDTLSGLLPICSHCKKIRDDSGYWQGVEQYIAARSDAQFSHGICPDCMREYYPKVAEKVLGKIDKKK